MFFLQLLVENIVSDRVLHRVRWIYYEVMFLLDVEDLAMHALPILILSSVNAVSCLQSK